MKRPWLFDEKHIEKKMVTVGLTGGFRTGKTTALAMFEKCGARVLDADELVHEELKKNTSLKLAIKTLAGKEVFRRSEIQRPLLAKKVFSDPEALEKLNALVHPYVKKRIMRFLDQCRKRSEKGVVAVEVPLLFEAGFETLFDVLVVVAAGQKVLKRRLSKDPRFTLEDRVSRNKQQITLDQKIARCDFVIDNSRAQSETFSQVKGLMDHLLSGKIGDR
jgi:dephospho-CoA kinase